MDEKFRSRKFLLALMSLITGIGALFSSLFTGSEFIALVGVVLGLYGGANVGQAYANRPRP